MIMRRSMHTYSCARAFVPALACRLTSTVPPQDSDFQSCKFKHERQCFRNISRLHVTGTHPVQPRSGGHQKKSPCAAAV